MRLSEAVDTLKKASEYPRFSVAYVQALDNDYKDNVLGGASNSGKDKRDPNLEKLVLEQTLMRALHAMIFPAKTKEKREDLSLIQYIRKAFVDVMQVIKTLLQKQGVSLAVAQDPQT